METVGEYEYSAKDLIGHGAFAVVFKGRYQADKSKIVAIKSITKKNLAKSQNLLEKEIKILKELTELQHENVVALLDCKETVTNVFLVMEYCNGGDLADYLHGMATLSEDTIRLFLKQISGAMRALNAKGVVHRDLKPQNILLCYKSIDASSSSSTCHSRHRPSSASSSSGGSSSVSSSMTSKNPNDITLKIADFGFARFLDDGVMMTTLCGSPLYMAPEVIMSLQYGAKADLWSIGTIVFQCLTGKAPFHAQTPQQLKMFYEKNPDLAPKIPSGTSKELTDLLMRLLKRNAKDRMEFDEFFDHPFMKINQSKSSSSSSASKRMSHHKLPHGIQMQQVQQHSPPAHHGSSPSSQNQQHPNSRPVPVPRPSNIPQSSSGGSASGSPSIISQSPFGSPSSPMNYHLHGAHGKEHTSSGNMPKHDHSSSSSAEDDDYVMIEHPKQSSSSNNSPVVKFSNAKTEPKNRSNSNSPQKPDFIPVPSQVNNYEKLIEKSISRDRSISGGTTGSGNLDSLQAESRKSISSVGSDVGSIGSGSSPGFRSKVDATQISPPNLQFHPMGTPPGLGGSFTAVSRIPYGRRPSAPTIISGPRSPSGDQQQQQQSSPSAAVTPVRPTCLPPDVNWSHFLKTSPEHPSHRTSTGTLGSFGERKGSLGTIPASSRAITFGGGNPQQNDASGYAGFPGFSCCCQSPHGTHNMNHPGSFGHHHMGSHGTGIRPISAPFASPPNIDESHLTFIPPELPAETLLDSDHNETLAKLNFILALVDCIMDLAERRGNPLSLLTESTCRKLPAETLRRAEQLVLYLRCLQLISSALQLSKNEIMLGKLKTSSSVRNVLKQLKARFHESLNLCKSLDMSQVLKKIDRKDLDSIIADKIIYKYAIEMCQSAALEELFGHPEECFRRYQTAQILLHSLSQQMTDNSDKKLLLKYKEAVERRLFVLQGQGFIYSYEHQSTAGGDTRSFYPTSATGNHPLHHNYPHTSYMMQQHQYMQHHNQSSSYTHRHHPA